MLMIVVGPRRTAAQVALGYIFHHESVLGKQFFRQLRDFLPVLKRTSRVISDDDVVAALCRREIEPANILGNILGERRNLGGAGGEIAVLTQHETKVLNDGAAARCRHQDGIEAAAIGLRKPGGYVGASEGRCCVLAAHMMGQCAATLLVFDQYDLDAVTGQQADGGLVDAWCQHLLRAPLQQRDPPAPLALSRKNASARWS